MCLLKRYGQAEWAMWMNRWSWFRLGKGEADVSVLAMLLVDFKVIHSREEGIHLHSSNDIVGIQHVK